MRKPQASMSVQSMSRRLRREEETRSMDWSTVTPQTGEEVARSQVTAVAFLDPIERALKKLGKQPNFERMCRLILIELILWATWHTNLRLSCTSLNINGLLRIENWWVWSGNTILKQIYNNFLRTIRNLKFWHSKTIKSVSASSNVTKWMYWECLDALN